MFYITYRSEVVCCIYWRIDFYILFTLGVPTVLVVMYIHWIEMDNCFLICFNHVPLFNAKFTLDGVCTSTL